MKRRVWALVFLAAIGALVAWATLSHHTLAASSDGSLDTDSGKPLIVDSDEHGALVLDVTSGEVIGFDAHGSVRWRDRDLAGRLYVSCLAQCPDAVGSGSPDGGAPPPVVWRTGTSRSIGGPVTGTVLWARSPQDAVVARDEEEHSLIDFRGARGTSTHRVVGTDPHLFTAPDASHAVLVLTQGGTASYRMLSHGPNGWEMSEPHTAPLDGACLGRSGRPVLVYGSNDTFLKADVGTAPHRLPAKNIGQCSASASALLTQEFTGSTDDGAHTVSRLLDRSGRVRWERTDTGIHSGDLDPDTGLVALTAETGVVVLDSAGRPAARIAGAVDAQFVRPGCLIVLTSDRHITTRCVRS
ncbi:hypothetical protein ACFY3M_45235 [Streptomyces mirabilis]|uniref:hypothetical protein n=1 Tax=Streptomyces mirabilis TaxID=68239 RepID=UPI0036796DA1